MLNIKRSKIAFVIFIIIAFCLIVISKYFQNEFRNLLNIQKFEWKENLLDKLSDYRNTSKCGIFPSGSDLIVENDQWQVLRTPNATFKLFNAYYDNRNYLKDEPVIRISAFISQNGTGTDTFCQFWYKGMKEPVIEKSFEYRLQWKVIWSLVNGFNPYFISCKNPLAPQVPLSVSLVANECDYATNNLNVIYNSHENQPRKKFAVCVKPLDFTDDQTMMAIEWIEILSLLGVDKIFIHVIKLHPNMLNVFKFYEKLGKVRAETITDPKDLLNRTQSQTQWFQKEMVSLNDCLYKHMYEYEFLVPLDIDEIIIPTREEDMSWMDLMSRLSEKGAVNKTYASFAARNVFFLSENDHQGELQPEVPANMHFLQHIYRARNFSSVFYAAKSFQNTELVLSMHNHFPLEWVIREDVEKTFYISVDDAKLQHYRNNCSLTVFKKVECDDYKENTLKDETLWKYKDELIANVYRTLTALKTFKLE